MTVIRMRLPRLTLQLGVVLLVVAAVAACQSAPTPTTPPPTAAPTVAAAPTEAPTETAEAPAAEEGLVPSNGNTALGPAITDNLTGDPVAGAAIFEENCKKCHGDQGTGGVENPGSEDGTIPPLNPADEDAKGTNAVMFAHTVDLFVEHGSKPEGDNPKEVMAAWGDDGKLTPQQIADVISYVVSLNYPQ